MNKFFRIMAVVAIMMVSLLGVLIPATPMFADDPIRTFPDPNLEASIRLAIGVPEPADIYQSNLSAVSSFNANSDGITDLTGMEYWTSLTNLMLDSNNISDISVLSNLTSLTTLTVNYNHIVDIPDLSGLTALWNLELGWNDIVDPSNVSTLSALTYLTLSGNEISDISSLEDMTGLNYLALGYSPLRDISPLANLSALDGLYLQYDRISNISVLVGLLQAGDNLNIENNPLNHQSYYHDIPDLVNDSVSVDFSLDVVRTFVDVNLDEQAHITTGVSNTSDIHQTDLNGVTTFFADGHYIVDLTGMEYWTTLNILNLGYNRIANISPLASLTALTGLYLDTNFISNISCMVGVLDSGDVLNVQTNALNEEAYTTDIPALEADGVAVYYDEEPYPAPTIPPPPSGNRSVFVLPVVDFIPDEAYFWGMFSYEQAISDCEEWYEVWEEMPLMVYYLTVVSNAYNGAFDLARALYGFNTSDIPDDAIITDAFLRVVPYWWQSDGLGDYEFVVGGTHNASIFPFIYDGENLMGANYSESEFYGDFGEFTVSDLPIEEGETNYNSSFYVDIPFNDDGVDYINPTGLTALSIRTQSDIDRICPDESGSVDLWIWAGQLGQYYYLPDIELIVDWHSPSDDIIITSAPISAMMTIQALIFTFGGILGIMALVLKPELFSFGIRAGLLLGLTIFTVIGVAMLESIIVAIT